MSVRIKTKVDRCARRFDAGERSNGKHTSPFGGRTARLAKNIGVRRVPVGYNAL